MIDDTKPPATKKPRRTSSVAKIKGEPVTEAQGSKVKVRPVINAIAILRYMTSVTKPVTVSIVAKELKLNVSTCFYIMRTLVDERIIKFDKDTRTYSIGVGLFDLSQAALAEGGTIPVIRPIMEAMARKYSVTITVWRQVDENHLMLVALADSEANMRIHMNIGQRVPLFVGAVGRLMAVHSGLDEAEMKRRFLEVRWQKPLRFETFLSQAKKAKREGWAIDDGYLSKGTTTVSVPVIAHEDHMHLACSATMFTGQHDITELTRIAQDLIHMASSLSEALSGG